MGAPGATDVATGIVQWAPNLGWREVHLAELISRRLDIPTVVDNDVNLALVGEVNQGVAAQAEHAVLISFRDGVGGAILVDGRLYRGRGYAGEVGYVVTSWPGKEPVHSFGATERSIAELLAGECESRGVDTASLKQETMALVDLLLGDDGELVSEGGDDAGSDQGGRLVGGLDRGPARSRGNRAERLDRAPSEGDARGHRGRDRRN